MTLTHRYLQIVVKHHGILCRLRSSDSWPFYDDQKVEEQRLIIGQDSARRTPLRLSRQRHTRRLFSFSPFASTSLGYDNKIRPFVRNSKCFDSLISSRRNLESHLRSISKKSDPSFAIADRNCLFTTEALDIVYWYRRYINVMLWRLKGLFTRREVAYQRWGLITRSRDWLRAKADDKKNENGNPQ